MTAKTLPTVVNLITRAATLPETWRSSVLAPLGASRFKLLRMDAAAYPAETHDYDEALLVVDGEMRLTLDAGEMIVRAGEVVIMPAGVPHAVAPGSRGTLVIIDPANAA